MSLQETPEYTILPDLASEEVGTRVVFVTDEFFADAKCMLQSSEAIFDPEKFTEEGKWMDGWESKRRRIPFHDWCIIKLGLPGKVKGFDVQTTHFTGNHTPAVSIEGACIYEEFEEELQELLRKAASSGSGFRCHSPEEIATAKKFFYDKFDFFSVASETPLRPGYPETKHNFITSACTNRVVTHLKINQLPDGGIARLRVYGEAKINKELAVKEGKSIDLASIMNGGIALCYSDAHFGSPNNILLPGKAATMKNGWETARSLRRPRVLLADENGNVTNFVNDEWTIIKLCERSVVECIEVDTNHFKGNYPETIEIKAIDDQERFDESVISQGAYFKKFKEEISWKQLLPRTKGAPHTVFKYGTPSAGSTFAVTETSLKELGPITHVLLSLYPDGGVSRLRIYGKVSP